VEHPKSVGDRTTLAVIAGLRSAGFEVLLPFGENTRYDLVIDDGDRLARVQCKTGRLREGAVRFNTCSSYAHHSKPRAPNRDYIGQVDYFAVHCSQTAGVYLVPIEDLPTRRSAALRVEPARNSQVRKIRPAAKYRVASVTVVATEVLGGRAGAGAPCA
jgi:PD-(D/E)XK endonuclease